MKKIAIVTVNYNGYQDTLELLASLKALQPTTYLSGEALAKSDNLLTIVVDNGSSDDSVTKILEKHPGVDLLQTGINKGFSGGYNRGLEHALIWGADYVLIINNDTTITDPDIFKKMLKPFESSEKIGVVAPKIYFSKGSEFHKDRYQEKDLGKVIWFAGGSIDWNNVYTVHRGMDEVDEGKYDQIEKSDFLTGCCLMIKREVLEKIGLFNDSYFAYSEDAEFGQRVKNAGFDLIYNGTTFIYHQGSKTSGVGSSTVDYYLTRNRLYFGMTYASSRTKSALRREAVKFLLVGRPAQKQAVLDYFQGKTGPMAPQKEAGDYQIKLSVVSVNYNTPELIDNLLKSIYEPNINNTSFNLPLPLRERVGVRGTLQNLEVIILDNGSDKGCAEVVKKYPEVRFLQNKVNTGFTGGYNKVMKYSRGEFILMLNSDVECTSGSLEQSLEEAEHYKGEAITSGALFFPDGTLQDSVFYLPTIWGAIK